MLWLLNEVTNSNSGEECKHPVHKDQEPGEKEDRKVSETITPPKRRKGQQQTYWQ